MGWNTKKSSKENLSQTGPIKSELAKSRWSHTMLTDRGAWALRHLFKAILHFSGVNIAFMAVTKLKTGKKRWRADWRDASGKTHRKQFATKREAEIHLQETQRKIRMEEWVDPKHARSKLLRDIYRDWIERVKQVGVRGRKAASARTVHDYEHIWRKYIEPRWDRAPLDLIRYEQVSEWINELTVGDRTKKVGRQFVSILGEAVRQGLLPRNPAQDRLGNTDYIPIPTRQKNHTYLTAIQLKTLVEVVPSEVDKLSVLLGGLCGLRFGEMTALRWGEIDIDRRLITVKQAYSDVGGKLELKTPKNGTERRVPLHKPTLELIEAIGTGASDKLVCPTVNGFPRRNGDYNQHLLVPALRAIAKSDKYRADEKVPETLRFHDLRHTAVSLAVSSGANVKVVQAIAGHSSASVTLDTYAGLFDADLNASAARVDATLSSVF